MPRGIPSNGKRGRKPATSFDLSSLQMEFDAHRQQMMIPIDRRIAELTAEIEQLNSFKASLGGNGSVTTTRRGRPPGSKNASTTEDAKPQPRRKGKRVRRSRSDVEAHAKSILDFVKSSKGGVSGTEIKDKFGKVTGTVKNYVKQYTGVDLHTAGPKTSMKYTSR